MSDLRNAIVERLQGRRALSFALGIGAVLVFASIPARWLPTNFRAGMLIAMALVVYSRIVTRTSMRAVWAGMLTGVLVVACVLAAIAIYERGTKPQEWDFLAFYVWGRTAFLGMDFYDPAAIREVSFEIPVNFTVEFLREIVDVGFFYPPFSIFLFAPFGALEVETAATIWAVLIAISIATAGIVFGRVAFKSGPAPMRVAAGLAVVLLLGGMQSIVLYQQTGALMLLCACMVLHLHSRPSSGIWAVVGVAIKPILAIPSLLIVLCRNWRGVYVAIACGIVLVAASVLAFGFDPWRMYLSGAVAARLPEWQFSEVGNQSLSSVLMRAYKATGSPAEHPEVRRAFWALASAMVAAAAWVLYRYRGCSATAKLAVLSSGAIVLYPGTGTSYGLLLAFPLAALANLMAATGFTFLPALGAALLIGALSYGHTAFWAAVLAFGLALYVASREGIYRTIHPQMSVEPAPDATLTRSATPRSG